jgi:hypothetical protein
VIVSELGVLGVPIEAPRGCPNVSTHPRNKRPALPSGTRVQRRLPVAHVETVTRSEPWPLPDGRWVVLLKGCRGAFLVDELQLP